MESLFVSIGCFVLGGVGAWTISRWGPTLGVLDRANHRSSRPQITQIGADLGQGKGSVKSVQSVDGMAWRIWSRLEVSSVVGKGRHLLFKRPLPLDVTFDVDEKESVLEFPDLNIFLSAYTPEELYRAFCEDMVWLWEEYGRCDDQDLSEDGIRLKKNISDLLESDVLP